MDDDYLEIVLDLVDRIPSGRAMTYGLVAEVVSEELVAAGGAARGGPRQVGRIMAHAGGGVPWWRVVNATGRAPAHLSTSALAHWVAEGTPRTADGDRVALRRAIWFPPQEPAGNEPEPR
ncbi:MAG TPA: MGMT family protein [Cellulomonas sp.]